MAEDSIHDSFRTGAIGVAKIVNGKPAACEILVERERSAFPGGVHVVMRQNFVPRISFHTKFEVAIPNPPSNALLDKRCRHMIVEFLAARECMPQRGQEFVRPPTTFGSRIDEFLIVTRLVSRDARAIGVTMSWGP